MFALVLLACLAIFDLVVGVSNDAVNFLNSSIGSKAAPRNVIMIIASLGMLAGVTFSSGMMEVARKGIFHPEFFNMPELISIFLAVMLTDIILLDTFNTFGFPTSTTVSIVFELLGAAVAVSLIKIYMAGDLFITLAKYINTGKALAIITGILLSVIVAFIAGAIVQFFARLTFTFDYAKTLKKYGGIWGGFAFSVITYFILIKGAKGTSFLSKEAVLFIKDHAWLILGGNFVVFGLLFQLLTVFTKINVLKPIVLMGTFALAMAFAANDLVNFIGVPLAGLSAYNVAELSSDPLNVLMGALKGKSQANTLLLLLAGTVMVITLWFSKKSRSVSKTELSLGRQDEGVERFGASTLSRIIVRMVHTQFVFIKKFIPASIQRGIANRLTIVNTKKTEDPEQQQSFDLLRASVNLMVASAVVSFATSLKLPLSTTYVTFMVSMGTSLSDQAWGRESAVYRVTGVLAVVGGWFVTALAAFTASMIFASIIFYFELPGIIFVVFFAAFLLFRSHHMHGKRQKADKALEAFNMTHIDDPEIAIKTSFEQTGYYLREISDTLEHCFEATFLEDRSRLNNMRVETNKINKWSDIITANIFRTLNFLQKEDVVYTQTYLHTIRSLKDISDSHRDLILNAYNHFENNHEGLTAKQIGELRYIKTCITRLLWNTSIMLLQRKRVDFDYIARQSLKLVKLVDDFDKTQIKRIQNGESGTRLSILFYGFMDNSVKISEQTHNLLDIFRNSFIKNGGHIKGTSNN
ncbi:MAG: inorganic phosphate transporter [Desulfobacterales bacterium]|nr:inorganic phosphate transporter [Desulfobacterales bacterium]MCP4162906.1 inorganic phosphate transporter [Deltaproteobacteria bacterium]